MQAIAAHTLKLPQSREIDLQYIFEEPAYIYDFKTPRCSDQRARYLYQIVHPQADQVLKLRRA
jgi:hypothetical protein